MAVVERMHLQHISYKCISCLTSGFEGLTNCPRMYQTLRKEAYPTREPVNGGRQRRTDVHGVVFGIKGEYKAVSRLVGPADLPTKIPLHQPRVLEGRWKAADTCKRESCHPKAHVEMPMTS